MAYKPTCCSALGRPALKAVQVVFWLPATQHTRVCPASYREHPIA